MSSEGIAFVATGEREAVVGLRQPESRGLEVLRLELGVAVLWEGDMGLNALWPLQAECSRDGAAPGRCRKP